MCAYGTNIVGGVATGNGGQKVCDRPVFKTVEECVNYTGADTSIIFLPAESVKDAAIMAIRAGIKLIVMIPEHIPMDDLLLIRKEARDRSCTIIGGNTPGIITPGQAYLGIVPEVDFMPGRVGTVSRSGPVMNAVAEILTQSGYGETTCVGLGGDEVPGSTFSEILRLFEQDPDTKAVIMADEIGSVCEETTANTILDMKTPVLTMIGDKTDTEAEKSNTLVSAGAHLCRILSDIPKTLEKLGI
jgi:succinyl-CoA synthetase alpha subunit